jgi:hypothetical protein
VGGGAGLISAIARSQPFLVGRSGWGAGRLDRVAGRFGDLGTPLALLEGLIERGVKFDACVQFGRTGWKFPGVVAGPGAATKE